MQTRIFGNEYVLNQPTRCHGLDDLVKESREIVQKAIIEHEPYSTCLMLSGGDDSITALKVALMLGVKIDYIIHGVTGTGLKAVKEYVSKVSEICGIKILYADAGTAFEDYVKRKGFFGVGKTAHSYSYHILKVNPFDRTISKHIRKGKPGRKIMLLNGVRVEESENRADNFGDNPYREYHGNIWVNIIHWWEKKDCLNLLEAENFDRSPVSKALGRSGECNCGTMQDEAGRIACSQLDPDWGEWMRNLRRYVVGKFGFDINQNPSKKQIEEIKKQLSTIDTFQPMCVGCKSTQLKFLSNETNQN